MNDYRASYATPNQIDSLWTVVGTLSKQIEQIMGELKRMEAGAGPGGAHAAVAAPVEAAGGHG